MQISNISEPDASLAWRTFPSAQWEKWKDWELLGILSFVGFSISTRTSETTTVSSVPTLI